MNTCKTCKWWNKHDKSPIPEWMIGRGDCESPKLSGDTSPSGLLAGDSNVYFNSPNTGPDFGCIHHKPK